MSGLESWGIVLVSHGTTVIRIYGGWHSREAAQRAADIRNRCLRTSKIGGYGYWQAIKEAEPKR